jgi:DNA-binding winged helix-turn-helix (wHTH) protein
MKGPTQSLRTLRFGVFEVDFRAAELHKHGIRIRLEEQPFHILALLLERPGDLVTREELRDKLWSADTFVDFDRSLNKAMSKLRLALGDSAETPRYIETLHRRGYRFIAPIQTQPANGSAVVSQHLTEGLNPSASGSTRVAAYLESGLTLRRWQVIAAAVLVLTALAAPYYLRSRQVVKAGSSASAVVPRRSVAVLGFKNPTGLRPNFQPANNCEPFRQRRLPGCGWSFLFRIPTV